MSNEDKNRKRLLRNEMERMRRRAEKKGYRVEKVRLDDDLVRVMPIGGLNKITNVLTRKEC